SGPWGVYSRPPAALRRHQHERSDLQAEDRSALVCRQGTADVQVYLHHGPEAPCYEGLGAAMKLKSSFGNGLCHDWAMLAGAAPAFTNGAAGTSFFKSSGCTSSLSMTVVFLFDLARPFLSLVTAR